MHKMDLKTMKETPPWDRPRDSAQRFLEALRDQQADESERLLAAELAGDFTAINNELAIELLAIVCSGEEERKLRARAAISLGPVLEHADQDGYEDPSDVLITEHIFGRVQESLRQVYMDANTPKIVRRRVLEAAVRASQDWHPDAIRSAYSSADGDWKLTAVFCMGWVRGFDDQILEALESGNPEIHYQAVCAAGAWGVDGAWSRIAALVVAEDTVKPLLLAAITGVAGIRPEEAENLLADLTDSDDEDIAEAAYEAMAMAKGPSEFESDDEDDDFLH